MAIVLLLLASLLTVAVIAYCLFGRQPEEAADVASGSVDDSDNAGHFAPGDAGAEDEAVTRAGEPGPA